MFFYIAHDCRLCKFFFHIRTDELEQQVKHQYHQKKMGGYFCSAGFTKMHLFSDDKIISKLPKSSKKNSASLSIY